MGKLLANIFMAPTHFYNWCRCLMELCKLADAVVETAEYVEHMAVQMAWQKDALEKLIAEHNERIAGQEGSVPDSGSVTVEV